VQQQPVADSGGDLRRTNGDDTPQRSAAEVQLAKLLQEQLKLSEDVSEEGERRYQAVCQEIARTQAEIDAAHQVETQNA
jgi:hypothetical protein